MGVDLDAVFDTAEKTETEGGIHAHIVRGDGVRTANAIILEARVNGTPVTALCGYTWVPSRNPENHPVCPKCDEIKEFDKDFHS